MPDRRGVIGSPEWRTAFEARLRARSKLARLGHLRSVSHGAPRFVDGNQAAYIHDGRLQLEWMVAAIDHAERRVDLEMYIFEPDASGKRVLDALVRAAQRGVFVRVLFDAIGSGNAGPSFFEPLAAAGGHVIEFNPVAPWRLRTSRIGHMQHWEPNKRDHRKLLVCDAPLAWAQAPLDGRGPPPSVTTGAEGHSAIAITGGRNIGDDYLGKPIGEGQWRDCGVVMFGPVALELGRLFDAMWFHADGTETPDPPVLESPPVGPLAVMPIGSQPGFLNLLQWTLSRLAVAVNQELRISCAYFIPSTRWRRALAHVARRTGRCALLIPKASDVPVVDAATRHLLGSLLKAGVSVYRYGREVLHEKTVIYDRVLTVVGSSNIDPRSFVLNYELSVVIVGASFADPVIRRHDEDLAASEIYTLDEWRGRPLWMKLGDWFWSLLRSQL
jgi:cardiolipin synthase